MQVKENVNIFKEEINYNGPFYVKKNSSGCGTNVTVSKISRQRLHVQTVMMSCVRSMPDAPFYLFSWHLFPGGRLQNAPQATLSHVTAEPQN